MFVAYALKLYGKAPGNESEYKPEYQEIVEKLEKYCNLTPDSIITISEYDILKHAVFPGSFGEETKQALERLCDLGYIQSLPDNHDVYENQFISAFKRFEKEKGMVIDGALFGDEINKLMKTAVKKVKDIPKSIRHTKSGNKITLSWSKVPGATLYEIRSYPSMKNDVILSSI